MCMTLPGLAVEVVEVMLGSWLLDACPSLLVPISEEVSGSLPPSTVLLDSNQLKTESLTKVDHVPCLQNLTWALAISKQLVDLSPTQLTIAPSSSKSKPSKTNTFETRSSHHALSIKPCTTRSTPTNPKSKLASSQKRPSSKFQHLSNGLSKSPERPSKCKATR